MDGIRIIPLGGGIGCKENIGVVRCSEEQTALLKDILEINRKVAEALCNPMMIITSHKEIEE